MPPPESIKPLLIAGPTASGKSAVALAAAARAPSLIINADSMQVYRDLSLLTARPSAVEEARAPHRLYGHVDGAEAYSAGRFVREAAPVLAEARQKGLRPIIVGGTGLYFRALLEGLSPVPAIPEDVRAHWRGEAGRLGAAGLHAVLAERDPAVAARLRPTDPQRIARALEVLEATGRSLADWQREPGEPLLHEADCECVVILPDRTLNYTRADARFDAMIAAGALDEVRALAARNLDPGLPVMRALGVPQLIAHLAGATSLPEAITAAKLETRHYIKRQATWLHRNMNAWKYITQQ